MIVGWALIMECDAAAAVSVGWSGYFSGTILHGFFDTVSPRQGRLRSAAPRGDQPAGVRHRLLVTTLLTIGTSEC